MDGNPHRVFAVAAEVAWVAASGAPLWVALAGAPLAAAVSAGPTSPDIDNTRNWRAVLSTFPGRADNKVLGHRRITHWWGWPALAAYLLVGADQGEIGWVAWALIIGWSSHIIGDFCFGKGGYDIPRGVPVLPWGWHVGLGWKSGRKKDRETGAYASSWRTADRYFCGAALLFSIGLMIAAHS